MADTGLYIAMLGIDGTGKTTMTKMLARELAAHGHDVKQLSWRKELDQAPRPNTRESLRQLWVESLRLVHLGVDGPAAPASYDEFHAEGWEKSYGSATHTTNVPAGPLAAAWLEWVGQILLRHEIVEPHRARGTHVIDESFSLKMAFKELLIAERLSTGAAFSAEVGRARELLVELFRSCDPDVGVLVTGPIEQAYRWRMNQEGSLGSLEDMGAATGDRGLEGFRELQSACDTFFRECAEKWGWIVLEMEDTGAEANFAKLRSQLLEHPAAGRLLKPA
ncbi:hypothetical protein OG689_35565 [Kitasatospora sp. NBC_00240]|uniref:hypothetical protein n=1 Tax=Kitasatospora sp. NBC_00240 TaxID=2903567 RepID=UPI0022540371|nr:hypothetical protein [Kitasatospora sp. NBC_00240]MCX5214519.1 hypothetical protein [Kitasatospora sp. NBC_00240]